MFVKVNMDGIAVGRKVDLNAYSSYEGLLRGLEEMFQPIAGMNPIVWFCIIYKSHGFGWLNDDSISAITIFC